MQFSVLYFLVFENKTLLREVVNNDLVNKRSLKVICNISIVKGNCEP